MTLEQIPSRSTTLGDLPIRRVLPVRGKRMIGAWCFLDRYGPLSFSDGRPMDVAAHPHIGIQTVSYLLDGEVVHYDSLGYEALLRPEGVNVMTSGGGIAHAEVTPAVNRGSLSGVQLWVAMTNALRNGRPSFEHTSEVARDESRGSITRAFMKTETLIGTDVQLYARSDITLRLRADFEYGFLLLDGNVQIEDEQLDDRTLYYAPPGRTDISLRTRSGARLLLLGGPPFPEKIVMWWNFVARAAEEIRAAREAWERGDRFGVVAGYGGPRIAAPDLVRFAPPNPAS